MNKQKHNILKALYLYFEEKEKKKHGGSGPTTLGQTLTVVELTNRTRLIADEIQAICYTLTNAGHIQLYQKDEINKSHRYLITDSGKQAYVDNFYINKLWFRNIDFWFKLLPIIITAGTLFWTVTSNNRLRLKIVEQDFKINKLQTSLDSIKTKQ